MRDLKANLEAMLEGAALFGNPNPGVNTQYELYEVAEHAIGRAIEAEALVKELIRDIGEAFAYAEHGAQEYYARERLKETIQKAKEVLGDE